MGASSDCREAGLILNVLSCLFWLPKKMILEKTKGRYLKSPSNQWARVNVPNGVIFHGDSETLEVSCLKLNYYLKSILCVITWLS